MTESYDRMFEYGYKRLIIEYQLNFPVMKSNYILKHVHEMLIINIIIILKMTYDISMMSRSSFQNKKRPETTFHDKVFVCEKFGLCSNSPHHSVC